MITEHMKKIAFAEGYHRGMLHEDFENPYADYDLRIQFNFGFRMATDRIDSLYKEHTYEELI